MQPADPSPTGRPAAGWFWSIGSDGTQLLAVHGDGYSFAATWLNADGAPAGDGFALGATPESGYLAYSHVVFDGSDFVVAWQALNGPDSKIFVQRVRSAGLSPVIDLGLPGTNGAFDLAVGGNQPLRVLSCTSSLFSTSCVTAQLDGDQSAAPQSIDLPFATANLDLELSGAAALALFETGDHAVVAAKLGEDGALLDTVTLDLAVGEEALPVLAAVPGGYMAAWHRPDGMQVVRLSVDGEITAQQLVTGDDSMPKLVPTSSQLLLLSNAESVACNGCYDVHARTLSLTLDEPVEAPVLIRTAVSSGLVAAYAASKVVAIGGIDTLGVLSSVSLDPKKLVAEPGAQPIVFDAPIQSHPVVSTAPDGWIAVWAEEERARGVLIDQAGAVRPLELKPPVPEAFPLVIEEGGGGWLAVWGGVDANVGRIDATGVAE